MQPFTVRRLIDGPLAPGRHEAELEAAGLPAGFYLVRLEAEVWRAESGIVLAR